MGSPDPLTHPVILFDGVCNLCNKSVLFVIARDSRGLFRFAPLQGSFAQQRLQQASQPSLQQSSVVLLDNGRVFYRSEAVLRIARQLPWPWPLLYGCIVVPRVLRDAAYNLLARHRYRLFGKQDECMVPTPELRARFID
jgi:predicted DCC family thiol-disulfide oxidoreductase YuxK